MNPRLKRKLLSIIAPIRRRGLINRSFSIISNNFWGGVVYDRFGLPYRTPTIGLYFFSNDYMEFLQNLEYYLSIEVVPMSIDNSKHKELLLERHGKDVLLGCLGGKVEIVFLHYKNIEDACKKWNYRRKRVKFDNLLIKYNDQNLFNTEHLLSFWKLPYSNKIFFTANDELVSNTSCILFSKNYMGKDGALVNDTNESFLFFDVKKYLNSMIKKGETDK